MDQKTLCVAAKRQQGLTSDNQLALRLGVDRSRVSKLVHGKAPADEAEIMMLADMAEIDPHIAFAAVHKDREKNPAKRAFWEKISMQFAAVLIALTALFSVGVSDAKAAGFNVQHSINYAHLWPGTVRQPRLSIGPVLHKGSGMPAPEVRIRSLMW